MTNILINKTTLYVNQTMWWSDGRKVNPDDYPKHIVKYDETDKLLDTYTIYKYDPDVDEFIEIEDNGVVL